MLVTTRDAETALKLGGKRLPGSMVSGNPYPKLLARAKTNKNKNERHRQSKDGGGGDAPDEASKLGGKLPHCPPPPPVPASLVTTTE